MMFVQIQQFQIITNTLRGCRKNRLDLTLM